MGMYLSSDDRSCWSPAQHAVCVNVTFSSTIITAALVPDVQCDEQKSSSIHFIGSYFTFLPALCVNNPSLSVLVSSGPTRIDSQLLQGPPIGPLEPPKGTLRPPNGPLRSYRTT